MTKKQNRFRKRRIIFALSFATTAAILAITNPAFWQKSSPQSPAQQTEISADLNSLEIKGRAPKTGYSRDQFGKGWAKDENGCNTRNKILKRDLKNTTENNKCQILTGTLDDPYIGKTIEFSNKSASKVQIDHVVALSDAWQKGAQNLSENERKNLANDPLNLLAVDGPANQQKGDSDAATWLPTNKSFRCEYVKRQISVKKKYHLWVTQAEKSAIAGVLSSC